MISHIWPNPQTNSNTHLLTLDYCVSSTRWYYEATSYIHYPQKIKIWAIIPFWAIATAQSHSLHNGSWLKVAKELWLRFQLGAVGSWFLAKPWQHYCQLLNLKHYSQFSNLAPKAMPTGGSRITLSFPKVLSHCPNVWASARGFRIIPRESNQFLSIPSYD